MRRLEKMRGVLIDTDAAFDDYLAMLYLLKHPDIRVDGITVTGTGAAHATCGAMNVSNMLTLLDDARDLKIPVARGAGAPMVYSNTLPCAERDAADSHYDTRFDGVNPYPVLDNALDFLRDYLVKCSEPVTVLCIGGGSNWGQLFKLAKVDPQLRAAIDEKVERIIMMGGNLLSQDVKPGAMGNIQSCMQPSPYYTNKVAEWNLFLDPLGAQYIFSSGIPVTMVALNATSHVPITEEFVAQLAEIDSPVALFLTRVLNSESVRPGIGKRIDFQDALAACVVVDPALVTTACFKIRVEQELNEENDTSGMIIVDGAKGAAVEVALAARRDDVYREYLDVIASESPVASLI